MDGRPTDVTHSDVQGGWPGTGNIDVNPLFMSASANDYRLQAASPCRSAGLSIDGTSVDMGAYE